MYDIVVIGGGNVATHMYRIFKDAALKVAMATRGANRAEGCYSIDRLPSGEIYLIAIKDDIIEELSSSIASQIEKDAIVCHTAGSVSIDALPESIKNRGVFYPLQSFTKGRELSATDFTIFIEANNKLTLKALGNLAKRIEHRYVELSSSDRERMHLAAVFTSNFTNHMYTIAEEILRDSGVDFSHMRPLIAECATKAVKSNQSPRYLQTGPAARGDSAVIEHHQEMLEDQMIREIYSILSKSIESRRDEEL